MTEKNDNVSYAAAGVDIEAGDKAVELFAPLAKKATRPEVRGGLGGFAGLFALGKYRKPLLAAGSDGVGTKLAIAQAMDKHDTIGIDLVAMCVDDLVVCGAEPLFLQDYIAIGKVVPEHVAQIVSGIAEGCIQAGCALLGGETAEHPGVMEPEHYDVSATAVGVVEADEVLGPDRVRNGDVVIAMASSGLHSNGYSLARHVLLDKAGLPLDGHIEEFDRTLGEELLEPTKIYTKDCLALADECEVHTFCHVTGGGLAGNLARVIPEGLTAELSRATWTPGQIFRTIETIGQVPQVEMEKTFNMGVGMVAVVAPKDRDRALAILTARHIDAWELGTVRATEGEEPSVILTGNHPRY
ncbi:phosphoribosylformylglycinamidine cyclo-ligase [Corynebacterium diphtheriae bv. mitis]|uniref:phosphoribosylformylglycinamidine cyclo-ligase n=1 Tax=Corynebacterium diphtheriae TaxID=1717 RepID=UPI0008FB2032|nr:phosphoribosylformylglycinamidine cyclo-ligase [Corynebacterium diphtheriae]OWN40090.1 phosphoribosylaminoimidazole synthetase [Corynebacterium belfantii]MBG9312837.1 phosphoribosylformylglycinamidine cyclo-ligase [Corynebacterium diphtheriae bv. mitis]MBG9358946.1 phosphoribosylformylglycinamidine cyclo-ligase [Corynebacterium diphtheriae bv. mitis]MBG9361947.1 phosphoribosylformylglycinamidine cyclo-ligase [Corynebacterium diphtheriae bv. mitis]MBG9364142.1 phosphoribosylformylglycinamidi